MDDKTAAKLNEINAGIPDELKKGLLKEVKDPDTEVLRDRARWELQRLETDKNKLSTEEQQKKRDMLLGVLATTNTPNRSVVDQRVTKEISEYLDQKIKRAIRSGEIDPADRREYMDFIRRHER